MIHNIRYICVMLAMIIVRIEFNIVNLQPQQIQNNRPKGNVIFLSTRHVHVFYKPKILINRVSCSNRDNMKYGRVRAKRKPNLEIVEIKKTNHQCRRTQNISSSFRRLPPFVVLFFFLLFVHTWKLVLLQEYKQTHKSFIFFSSHCRSSLFGHTTRYYFSVILFFAEL